MSEPNREQACTCIYCGRNFSIEDLQWLISDQTEDFFAKDPVLNEARAHFESVMNAFHRLDTRGAAFCNSISGKGSAFQKAQQIRLVTPEDFAPVPEDRSRNTYRPPDGSALPIFYRLSPEDSACPGLRFTDEFVNQIDRSMGLNLRDAKDDIERCGIRPVCPHCTSYLPDLLLSREKSVRVVRLGLIGPAGSGKTTLNAVNIICGCLNCGGWVAGVEGICAPPHYLLENYYKPILENKEIPQPLPDSGYISPLLVQMEHGAKRVLLVLMDIPAKVLETIRQAVLENTHTQQTISYLRLLRQLDGCLLLLDAQQEILPRIDLSPEAGSDQQANQPTLESLIQIFSGVREWRPKPAALLISKCDWLFKSDVNMTSEKWKELFSSFSDVDKALWQQPKEAGTYSADRHEAVQYSFKPLVQKLFPNLWAYLGRYFSRVDVFPQSNLGDCAEQTDPAKALDPSGINPFFSADPVIWLLNMIR